MSSPALAALLGLLRLLAQEAQLRRATPAPARRPVLVCTAPRWRCSLEG